MKVETIQENGWVRYMAAGPGTSPIIRQHFSGEVTLISPSDREDKVTLSTAEEKIFVLLTLERVQKNGLGELFEERFGDLKIAYTRGTGLTIRRRGTPNRQFHCTTQKSINFLVEVLTLISTQYT